jgi:hypothetical protein
VDAGEEKKGSIPLLIAWCLIEHRNKFPVNFDADIYRDSFVAKA